MPRVVILDDISPQGLAMLHAAPGVEFEIRTGLKGDALRDALSSADGAICRSGVKITAEVLAGVKRLRAIVRAGVGTDNIDKDAATRHGVVVMNTPAGNTLSTAEHTFAMMLALSRNLAPAYQSLMEGVWDRKSYIGAQLAGKTLGVVGLGRIGQAVAARAKAFEMRVLGFDPFLTKQRASELGVDLVDTVRDMLPEVDYLTVHTPLTDETRGLVGMKELDLLRPGVRLINCARGGIYDEAALAAGLKSGKIAGVALDVFASEPCTSSPLFGMPGVLATPHLGASTDEAQTQVATEAVELLVDYLTTGAIRHAVNVAPIDPKTLAALRGYLDVAFRLGRLMAALQQSAPSQCRVLYRGEIAAKETKPLTAAFAAGLLHGALDEEVNLVNAEWMLRERGIDLVQQSRADQGAFTSSMSVEVDTQEGTHSAAGALFGQNMPRLIKLENYRLEAYLDGRLLVFQHRDVPGIIGAVGAIFGDHGVNIAQMTVGRETNAPGGAAIGVLSLDNDPPDAAIRAILEHPAITSARFIHLPPAGELPHWMSVPA